MPSPPTTTDFQALYQRAVGRQPDELRRIMKSFKVAPYASDPATTLKPAPLMVVSMKPYGAPGRDYPFGWEQRNEQPGLHRWYDGSRSGGNFVREADLLLQGVLKALNHNVPPRDVFNTYAYFFRAKDAAQLKAFGLANVDCSTFHRFFLDLVRPKLVLCIGNGAAPSAFALYRGLLEPDEVEEATPTPRTKVKWFRVDGTLVVGVPHLSYVRAATVLPTVVRLCTNS